MSTLRHTSWAAAATVALVGSRFGFSALLAHQLPVSVFGQVAYGQWLVDIAFLTCSLGATGFIARYAAEFRHDPAALSTYLRHWQPFARVLPWVAGGTAPLLGAASGIDMLPGDLAWMAVATVAGGMWVMQTAALSGLQRFDLICGANVVAATILISGAVVMPPSLERPGYAFGVMALAAGAAAVVGRSLLRDTLRSPDIQGEPPRWRAAHSYAINMWITALLWSLVWSRGEVPIVQAALGNDGVGRYATVLTLFGGAIQAIMLLTAGVGPQLTRFWGEGLHQQALAMARRVMDIQLLVAGTTGMILVLFGADLLDVAFGAAYRTEARTLGVMALGLLAIAASHQSHLLQITTDGRFTRNTSLAGLLGLALLAMILIPRLGLLGAALARGGTMLLMAFASLLAVRRRWGAGVYSVANASRVLCLLGVCLVITFQVTNIAVAPRAGLALLGIALVLKSVRNAAGQLEAEAVVLRVRSALEATRFFSRRNHPE